MKDMNYCPECNAFLPDGGQHKPMCPKTRQAQLAAAERQIKELRWSLKMQMAIKALEHGRKR